MLLKNIYQRLPFSDQMDNAYLSIGQEQQSAISAGVNGSVNTSIHETMHDTNTIMKSNPLLAIDNSKIVKN